MNCKEKILSEEYGDYILDFVPDSDEELCQIDLDESFSVVYSMERDDKLEEGKIPFRYRYIPKLYGLMEEGNIAIDDTVYISSGIKRLQRPPLSLTGKGCVICIVDTGIDYTLPDFRDSYGNSRILGIWDQENQEGVAPEGFFFGTEFTREQIEEALQEKVPARIVGTTDENGHGTRMALLAAGQNGAAPEAFLVIVKLKQCKQYFREFYSITEEAEAYQESDIMLGIKYGEKYAKVFGRPIVFCIGLGTNMGDHAGKSFLDRYAGKVGLKRNRCMVVCSGNEGNEGHHFSAQVNSSRGYEEVELRVGEEEDGFCMEFWGEVPDMFVTGVRSPGGESIAIDGGIGGYRDYHFIFESTVIEVERLSVEVNSGKDFIRFRFLRPTPGIWTIRVSVKGVIHNGIFHMWLPIKQFLKSETYFLKPDPNMTITAPGMNENVLTVGGYNDKNDSFYLKSGRGYNASGNIKPDIVAPAVDIRVGNFLGAGSCLGAAICAGAVAQFMEWAVERRNLLLVETVQIKNYLINGATRKPAYTYPNREWGYGALNMQGVYEVLAGFTSE